ncbi:MAG: hypothetical protein ACRDKI_05600 [Solirubrobacterales bacterium]
MPQAVVPARSVFVAALLAALASLAIAVLAPAVARADDPAVVTINAPLEGEVGSDSSSAPVLDISTSGDVADQSCKYDKTAYHECTNLAYPGLRLSNGAHSYTVRTVDTLGNVTLAVVNFTISDSAAPTAAIAAPPDPITDQLALDITTDDSHARVYGWIDDGGAEPIGCGCLTWHPTALPNGTHTAYVLVIDGAGNAAGANVTFEVQDTTAPDVVIDNPTDGSTHTIGTLRAHFDSSDPFASYLCLVDDQAPQACQPDSTSLFDNLTAGAHTFTVFATDQAGNSGATTTNFTVTDTPVAGLTITGPADGATYTAQPLLQLSAATPLEDFTLRCSVNGAPAVPCLENDPVPGVDANGNWTLVVTARDDNGDKVAATSTFTVNDTTGPTVGATPPAGAVVDVDWFVPDIAIEDSYADSSFSPATRLRCKLDANPETFCFQMFFNDDGPDFTPGAHSLLVTGFDWIGNSTSATLAFTVTDATAPAVQILAPQNGDNVSAGSFTVDFVVTGYREKVECQIGAGPRTPCDDSPNDGYFSWSPPDVPSGSVTFHVYATDRAGNTGSASVTIDNADSTGPNLSFITPTTDGATITDRIIAHVISDEPIFKLRCGLDSQANLTANADTCVINGDDRTTGYFWPFAVDSGAHTFWVEASDNHGNVTVISRDFVAADTTAPDLFIDGFNVNDSEPTNDSPRTLDYHSNDKSASFTCSLDGGADGACGSAGYGSFLFDALADGPHSVTVTAWDAAGNSTVIAVPFTVADTTPPKIFVDDAYDGVATGASFTSTPYALGATGIECALDDALFAPCPNGGWTVTLATSGMHKLHYRATDAAGNAGLKTIWIQTTLPSMPPVVPPPVHPDPPPLPKAKATIGKLKPKATKRAVTLPVAVAIELPAGVSASNACRGNATIAAVVGKKTVKSARAALKLVKSKCVIAVKLKIKPKLIAGKRFTLTVSFPGNSAITSFSGAKTGKSGRAK